MNAPDTRSSLSDTEVRQLLSSLADGRVEHAQDLAHASAAWRDEAEARATWHCYQLIGDVLRSEDLARPAAPDSAFLARLRQRLADEPVVLAPAAADDLATEAADAGPAHAAQALAQTPRPHAWWRRATMPAAVAAGFGAVAVALVVARWGLPGGAGEGAPLVAWWPGQPAAVEGVLPVSQGGWTTPGPSAEVASGPGGAKMIRDPQLDAYLRAHRGVFAGTGQPAAAPRSLGGTAPLAQAASGAAR
jgi:sigma-E factor negative regulatory protein RseA